MNRINPIIVAALIAIAVVFGCMAITTAAGIGYSEHRLYMPSVAQKCGNPCASSIPYPTLTPTPDIGEPPMPTESK